MSGFVYKSYFFLWKLERQLTARRKPLGLFTPCTKQTPVSPLPFSSKEYVERALETAVPAH